MMCVCVLAHVSAVEYMCACMCGGGDCATDSGVIAQVSIVLGNVFSLLLVSETVSHLAGICQGGSAGW